MNHEYIQLNLRKNRVPYFNLYDKMKEKRKIKKKLDEFNNFLYTYGLSFSNVEITTIQDNYNLTIAKNRTIDKQAAICQTAKDLTLMSERSYNIFRKALLPNINLSSLLECNLYKQRVNKIWLIGDNDMGSYVKEPVEKIKFVCSKYLEKLGKSNQVKDNTFNILLSGDGVSLTKTQINILNFTFSLLNDGDLSLRGFYILGKINYSILLKLNVLIIIFILRYFQNRKRKL